ncbi:EamA family transporter RarD [Corynebacterium anserum]|uniref:EamA family transporter RarD n=1 Tax=Corynebacterium anserum TaxID=2684406 RepID=A0A7G7YN01_9CORY|nr:EamA family transporter RarD [Corynebacterium anserum]MBC2680895.1 EamA family transporter RarD [Corynebacterium anserum]QNH95871.1 EamA family transporter RarD [Corynebacterium anserum]
MIWGLLCYGMWGLFPAFFPLLKPAAPVEILSHRVVWTFVFMAVVLFVIRATKKLRAITQKEWLLVAAAAAVISVNWGLYVYAVNNDHVADAALGYFINPLVSVMLAVLVLREGLSGLQRIAIGLAFIAVVIMTIMLGNPPWISLGLAFSFGVYGLIKKKIRLSPQISLMAETTVLAPFGVMYILYLQVQGRSTFVQEGTSHTVLLMLAGVVTALPLLCFARAAHEMTLTSLGMIQYFTPMLQMLWAVFVTKEYIEPGRWVGFVIIWIALVIFVYDLLRQTQNSRRARRKLTSLQDSEAASA